MINEFHPMDNDTWTSSNMDENWIFIDENFGNDVGIHNT
jgi:hypothetical protein